MKVITQTWISRKVGTFKPINLHGVEQIIATLCSLGKYPYSPHGRDWKFLGGRGSQRPKKLSKCMMLDWNFQRGGVV